jgi:hypothetical protein
VPKFGLIFRRGLQIELCEALKHSAFFNFRWKLFGALPKVAPKRTAGNKTIWPKHLTSPCHVTGGQLCHTRSEPPSATHPTPPCICSGNLAMLAAMRRASSTGFVVFAIGRNPILGEGFLRGGNIQLAAADHVAHKPF